VTGGTLLALVLVSALAWSAGARQQQEDPRSRIRSTVSLVVVPVTVKDATGEAVLDVRQDEFRIFEDGVEQEVELYSNEPFPLSAVVLLDNGLTRKRAEELQESAGAIAGGFSQFDEVAIALFDTIFQPYADFLADNDQLHEQLKRIELTGSFPGQGSAPMTSPPRANTSPGQAKVPSPGMRASRRSKNLDDAIMEAALLLRDRARERRKIILIVSDGTNSGNNTYSYNDTLQQLLSADISVYAIGVGEARMTRALNPLARYARSTGGDVVYAASRSELESLYSTLTEEARNQYTLAYVPRGTDRSQEYHSIEVRVRRPNLTLLAREGYFAPAIP